MSIENKEDSYHRYRQLHQLSVEHSRMGNFLQYSNDLWLMSEMDRKEGRHIDQMKLVLVSMYFDLVGFQNLEDMSASMKAAKSDKNIDLQAPMIGPRKVKSLLLAMNKLGSSTRDVGELFLKTVTPMNFGLHPICIEDCLGIILAGVDGMSKGNGMDGAWNATRRSWTTFIKRVRTGTFPQLKE